MNVKIDLSNGKLAPFLKANKDKLIVLLWTTTEIIHLSEHPEKPKFHDKYDFDDDLEEKKEDKEKKHLNLMKSMMFKFWGPLMFQNIDLSNVLFAYINLDTSPQDRKHGLQDFTVSLYKNEKIVTQMYYEPNRLKTAIIANLPESPFRGSGHKVSAGETNYLDQMQALSRQMALMSQESPKSTKDDLQRQSSTPISTPAKKPQKVAPKKVDVQMEQVRTNLQKMKCYSDNEIESALCYTARGDHDPIIRFSNCCDYLDSVHFDNKELIDPKTFNDQLNLNENKNIPEKSFKTLASNGLPTRATSDFSAILSTQSLKILSAQSPKTLSAQSPKTLSTQSSNSISNSDQQSDNNQKPVQKCRMLLRFPDKKTLSLQFVSTDTLQTVVDQLIESNAISETDEIIFENRFPRALLDKKEFHNTLGQLQFCPSISLEVIIK